MEKKAQGHAILNVVPEHLAEVRGHKITLIAKTEAAVKVFDNLTVGYKLGRSFFRKQENRASPWRMFSSSLNASGTHDHAAQALGLSEACLSGSIKYAKERTVFGAPLGNYQITMQKLTEMAIKIEALRGFVYKSAWLVDNGTPDYTLAAMGKYLGGQTAVFCANAGVEIHGGYGYMDEYDVQKWYRDAKILELYEGTKEAEIMTIGKYLQTR